MDIQIEVARGQAVLNHLDALAALRLEVFRDWPYLYEGTLDYERQYLRTYANCSQALCVLAMADGKVVGASTALPLCDEPPEVQAPFLATGWDITRVFYFGKVFYFARFVDLASGTALCMHASVRPETVVLAIARSAPSNVPPMIRDCLETTGHFSHFGMPVDSRVGRNCTRHFYGVKSANPRKAQNQWCFGSNHWWIEPH